MKKEMKKIHKGIFLIFLSLVLISSAKAESLFSLNASQATIIEPKPLFCSVRARNVGDLVSIVIEEAPNSSDNGSYSMGKSNSFAKNVTKIFSVLSKSDLASAIGDNTDGTLEVANSTVVARNLSMNDTIAAQVVQVLPNGNLLVQGKKSLVSQNERVDMIISGIVDPKWINQKGEVSSSHVANLQFAMNGSGTVSRGQNEGVVNKVMRVIF